MSSNLSLGYYYRTHGNLTAFSIVEVPPDAIVDGCKRPILQNERSLAPVRKIELYQYPLGDDLSLEALELNLGEMSVSALGEPLFPLLPLQTIFGSNPVKGHLHFVVVDRSIPLTVTLWIPGTGRRFNVEVKEGHTPNFLLRTIKEEIPAFGDGFDLAFYKTSYRTPGELGPATEGQLLPEFINLFTAFDDVPFVEFPCVRVVRQERKNHLSWDLVERATTRRKLYNKDPSLMGIKEYLSLQTSSTERLLDYRRHADQPDKFPERDLPPIEVLFDGFGKFLDIWRAYYTPSESAATVKMMENVELFVDAMYQVYSDDEARHWDGLTVLNDIFPAVDTRTLIKPADLAPTHVLGDPPRTDGHSVYKPHGIPCIIVEFRNEDAGSNAIPIVELAGYYSCMVKEVAERCPTAVRGSRLPTLGITVVGPTITFYAVAYVGSVVYVPLTTGLWCLPVESGGSDRRQLYTAFSAAIALVASIDQEAKRITDGHPPVPLERPFYPQINRLVRYPNPSSSIDLKITGFVTKDLSRNVYAASSSSGNLVIKLTRSYSTAMHAFCATLGYAPKLLAFERLPGGVFAVAMEYLKGEPLSSLSSVHAQRRDQWVLDLKGIVKKMHDEGFVHGDLRPPNILCLKDGIMLLDFDWGGKVGEAHYPHPRLNPELITGRDMSSLNITKEDDDRTLKHTVKYIMELRTTRMEEL